MKGQVLLLAVVGVLAVVGWYLLEEATPVTGQPSGDASLHEISAAILPKAAPLPSSAIAHGTQGERRNPVLLKAVETQPGLAERDHKLLAIGASEGMDAALRYIKENYPLSEQQRTLGFLMGQLGKRDLEALLTYYPAFTDKLSRQFGLGLAADYWIKNNSAKLLEFIEAKTSGLMKSELFSRAVDACWNNQEWNLGAQFLDRMPFSAERSSMLFKFSMAYSAFNPEIAANWARNLELPDERQVAEQGVVTALDRTKNLEILMKILPGLSPQARGGAKELLGKISVETGVSISALLQTQAGQPGSVAPILIGAIRAASKEQLTTWRPEVNRLQDPNDRSRVMGEFVGRLFALDQNDGVQFAMSLQGKERDSAIRSVVTQWYALDSLQLSDWANRLPRGQDQDVAFETIVRFLRRTDVGLAKKVAASISNESKRNSLLRTLPEK